MTVLVINIVLFHTPLAYSVPEHHTYYYCSVYNYMVSDGQPLIIMPPTKKCSRKMLSIIMTF